MPASLTRLGHPLFDSTPVQPNTDQSLSCIVCQGETRDVCVCGAAVCDGCLLSLALGGANHSALCHLCKGNPQIDQGFWISGLFVRVRAMPMPRDMPASLVYKVRHNVYHRLLDPLLRRSVAIISCKRGMLLYSTYASPAPAERQAFLHIGLRAHLALLNATTEDSDPDRFLLFATAVTVVREARRDGVPEALCETLYRFRGTGGTSDVLTALDRERVTLDPVQGGYVLGTCRPVQPRYAVDLIALQRESEEHLGLVPSPGLRALDFGKCVFETKFH